MKRLKEVSLSLMRLNSSQSPRSFSNTVVWACEPPYCESHASWQAAGSGSKGMGSSTGHRAGQALGSTFLHCSLRPCWVCDDHAQTEGPRTDSRAGCF